MIPALPPRYQLLSDAPLGAGGMGTVWAARDAVLDTPVAIKVVRSDLAAQPLFRDLFELEVQAAARFVHPNVVPIHDVGALEDHTPFLALAFADAGNVGEWVEASPGWSAILGMSLQLLGALGHLHARGVLHRDVKPENVLLHTGPGGALAVWLADLGLASSASELARGEARTEGTPGYMAPEQAHGLLRELGPSTDLYAVGVMLWQLVTGKRPFPRRATALDLELPPLVPQPGLAIPAGLDSILANCLAADPLARYDLAADLAAELLALGAPILTAASGRFEGPRPRGTIAPAAPSLSEVRTSASASVSAPTTLNTLFDDDVAPVWNRPLPDPIPDDPPPEPESPTGVGASPRLFALRDPPLVGREQQRRALWRAAAAVRQDGRSRVVLLTGAAGSGKTHLVRSVVHPLVERGFAEALTLTWHREPEPGDGFVGAARELIRPWNEAPRELAARLSRRIARERGVLDAATVGLAEALARWGAGDAAVPDAVALQELHRHVEARTWRGVSLLVLEDPAHAREAGDGLALAEAALRGAADGERDRVLILATVRSEDLGRPEVGRRVRDLLAAGALHVEVPPLEPRLTRRVLSAWLPLDPALADRVVARCQGNVRLARDLLVGWAERGWLVDTGGFRFGLAAGVDLDALPVGDEGLVRERVARLAAASPDPEAFLVATHRLALAGAAVSATLFDRLAGEGRVALLASGLWVARGDRVQFADPLVLEVLRVAAQERLDREALAEAVFTASEGAASPIERGRWALGAGRRFEAVELLLGAAAEARRRGRSVEADEAARLAVDATRGREPYLGARAYAWLAWGYAALSRGDAPAAHERLSRALRRLQAMDDAPGVASARLGLGTAATERGLLDEAAAHLAAALRACEETGLKQQRAAVIAAQAALEVRRRNRAGAELLFRRAEGAAEAVGWAAGVARAVLGQARLSLRAGELKDAAELFAEARKTFDRARAPAGVVEATCGEADVAVQQGRLDVAERQYRRVIDRAERLGVAAVELSGHLGLADVLRGRGERDEAARRYRLHLAWAERIDAFDAAARARVALVGLALDAGDLAAAHEALQGLSTALAAAPGHDAWARYRLLGAGYLAAVGDAEEARGWLWAAGELGLGEEVDIDVVARLVALAEHPGAAGHPLGALAARLAIPLCRRLGDEPTARRLAAGSRRPPVR